MKILDRIKIIEEALKEMDFDRTDWAFECKYGELLDKIDKHLKEIKKHHEHTTR